MSLRIKIGDSKVLESREAMDGTMIRRRRVTSDGKIRFTTYERIEMPTIMVRKRSGNREEFDRDKLITWMQSKSFPVLTNPLVMMRECNPSGRFSLPVDKIRFTSNVGRNETSGTT